MTQELREIDEITFGIYSPEEVMKMSVCKIDNAKKSGIGSVYDPRMGTTDSTEECRTCKQNATNCPGHFGHIELEEPVVHPLYYKRVTNFLNCFCTKCYRLLITKDQIFLSGINRLKGERRFKHIIEKLKKVDICCQPTGELDENGEPIICGKDHALVKFTTSDSSYSMVYLDNKSKSKTSVVLSTEEIKKILDNIPDSDVELIGFDPKLVHPRNFIITILPVCPPCDRPYVKADGKTCDDDLTIQYTEIIKANNNLCEEETEKRVRRKREQTEQDRAKARASLRFRILTTFNNGQGKAKHTTNGRAIKGIKERLTGKDGQIRNNMMGKRSVLPDTPVLMWSGETKTAENIKIGDIVIGDDGLPRTVVDTVTGTSPLYKVEQSYGDDYGISCEHILTLKFCGHCEIMWRENQGNDGGWFMSWYDRETKSCMTKKFGVLKSRTKDQAYKMICDLRDTINQDPIIDIHVKDYMALPSNKKRLMMGVKLGVPINWKYQETKLDPRILGMWLGDGTSRGESFTSVDSELVEYWRSWAEQEGGKITQWDDVHYGVAGSTNANPLLTGLREYDLVHNKHIPTEYLFNSEQVRLEVLAGFIDTDGSVEQDGRTIRITQSNEHQRILTDTEYLAKSLGFRATLGTKKTTWNHKGVLRNGSALVLTISGYGIDKIPTLLYRKQCQPPKGTDMTCYSIKVVDAGIGRYCGFEVDQNNRFLLGDFTVTHNCDQTGRTVIGPDPTLKMGELAVPEDMTKILTVPVRVNKYNFQQMQDLVNSGKVKTIVKPDDETVIEIKRFRRGTRLMHGDIIHRAGELITVQNGRELVQEGDQVERDGEFLTKLKVANRDYKIDIGYTVNRPLQDGDYVLLNRQPTLHKASMMAMKILIKPHKTLRMNLACTKPFNADFDGDEMDQLCC